MGKGIIATATFDDCKHCVNHYGDKFCKMADSVKYNLRLVEHDVVRCGLFTEIEPCES